MQSRLERLQLRLAAHNVTSAHAVARPRSATKEQAAAVLAILADAGVIRWGPGDDGALLCLTDEGGYTPWSP